MFRRCAAAHEERWDWFGAERVLSALSKDMEEERDEKRKIRRKGLKEKIRERERAVGDAVDATPELVVVRQPRTRFQGNLEVGLEQQTE